MFLPILTDYCYVFLFDYNFFASTVMKRHANHNIFQLDWYFIGHFDEKSMPSAGVFSFLRSLVCTSNNTCYKTMPRKMNLDDLNSTYESLFNSSAYVSILSSIDIDNWQWHKEAEISGKTRHIWGMPEGGWNTRETRHLWGMPEGGKNTRGNQTYLRDARGWQEIPEETRHI